MTELLWSARWGVPASEAASQLQGSALPCLDVSLPLPSPYHCLLPALSIIGCALVTPHLQLVAQHTQLGLSWCVCFVCMCVLVFYPAVSSLHSKEYRGGDHLKLEYPQCLYCLHFSVVFVFP